MMSENSSIDTQMFDIKNIMRYLIMNALLLYLNLLIYEVYPIDIWDRRLQNAIMVTLLFLAFWQNAFLYTEQVFKSRTNIFSQQWVKISKYIDILMYFVAVFCIGGSLFYSVGFVEMIIFYTAYTLYILNLLVGICIRKLSFHKINNSD